MIRCSSEIPGTNAFLAAFVIKRVLMPPLSATLVFGYHFDMAKKRILTQDEIDRFMNNSDELSELSEEGLKYSDDDVDFYWLCVI
ncbi:hypothetical protein TNCV_2802301 [Trichonephila clavipes]|nr:hypothetical protein TNCV_2802301 [Trichonephila clavipes]